VFRLYTTWIFKRKIQYWCRAALLSSRLFPFSGRFSTLLLPFPLISHPYQRRTVNWVILTGFQSRRAHNAIHESAWLSENYIYPGHHIKSLFRCWPFIRSAMATLILDEGTKINIVDDENKILDTGSTGKASTSSPPRMSFSESPWVSCVSYGRYTHAHAACHVGLNGGICIFYKLGVICIPGRAPPMLSGLCTYHDAIATSVWHTCTKQIPDRRFIALGVTSDQATRFGVCCSQLSHLLPRRTDTPMSIGMNLTNNQQ